MSPKRIDYYDSPEAPKANSLVPSVNVVVVNEAGEILLIRRTDNDNWAIPGGAIDLGESVAQAAVRETREESGIEVRWVPASELSGYTMDRSMRIRINDFLARNESPVII
jgi:ADP-ribose pyrophosphatase YjhB (NUDIX family)